MISDIQNHIRREAEKFGAKFTAEGKPISYRERDNTGEDALNDNGAYFGFIQPDEERTGGYHDLSFVIFPANDKQWVVALGIGTLGFKDDYELASMPGLRRLFTSVISQNGFCKTSFSDIETNLPKSFLQQVPHLKNTLKKYTKWLPACEIIECNMEVENLNKISAMLACYAKMREWGNEAQKREIRKAIEPYLAKQIINDEKDVEALLKRRKYIVLEGPPGTGKTRLAQRVCQNMQATTFFTQFHPEVSYSDFVYGIRPDTEKDNLIYKRHEGLLAKAIKSALDNTDRDIVLILDEINRANLSNVLGPLFYLLEYKRGDEGTPVFLPDGTQMKTLPPNLHIIGTMNTADRSLAVVDFALRRRFAWYVVKPKLIQDKSFYPRDFSAFDEIFNWYADSSELNFQPGHAYFFASDEEEMQDRLRFELFPLIKEYMAEGIMIKAKEELNKYFLQRIGKTLYD